MTLRPDGRMKLGLALRPGDERRLRIGQMVADRVKDRADLVASPEIAPALGVPGVPLPKMDVDILVAVGGDGTILHALQNSDAPVLGVNAGEIGFLTEIEPVEISDGLDRVLGGDYFVESRNKLATWLDGERLPDAANDAVVKTTRPAKILHFELRTHAGLSTRIRADGVVFSTPTGSTSYAMSAGGPIVDPAVEAFLVVPIAAFSLTTRPMVFPPSASIELRLLKEEREAAIVLDGQVERELSPGGVLRIAMSERKARFVRFRPHFYTRLAERLE